MSGIDRGDHEMEYDPVSDKIADIQDKYIRSAEFQDFLKDTIEEAEDHLQNIWAEVRCATGEDGIDLEHLETMLRAARAMYIRRHIPTPDELLKGQ